MSILSCMASWDDRVCKATPKLRIVFILICPNGGTVELFMTIAQMMMNL